MLPARERDPRCVKVQRAGCVAYIAGSGSCSRGRRGRRGEGVFCFGGEAFLDFGEGLLLALAQAVELFGYAGLDLEFEGFGARGVGLVLSIPWGFYAVKEAEWNTSLLDWRASTRFDENWTGLSLGFVSLSESNVCD